MLRPNPIYSNLHRPTPSNPTHSGAFLDTSIISKRRGSTSTSEHAHVTSFIFTVANGIKIQWVVSRINTGTRDRSCHFLSKLPPLIILETTKISDVTRQRLGYEEKKERKKKKKSAFVLNLNAVRVSRRY